MHTLYTLYIHILYTLSALPIYHTNSHVMSYIIPLLFNTPDVIRMCVRTYP